MASRYRMVASHLQFDELEYELRLRGVVPKSGKEERRKELRRFLTLEKVGQPLLKPDVQFDSETEFTACEGKVAVLGDLIDQFTVRSANKEFLVLNSRLCHLMGRVDRLPLTGDDQARRNALVSGVFEISERLQTKLRLRRELGHNETVSFLATSDPEEEDEVVNPSGHSTPRGQSRTITGAAVHMKSVPVYKWGLKFSGDVKDMSVGAFLERVEELSVARGISKDELLASAFDLFSGRALCWYRGIKPMVDTWDMLKSELRAQFQPSDYDFHLMDEIRKRTQGKGESMGIYLSVMNNLFARLSKPLTEEDKLQIMRRNIHPLYHDKFALVEVNTQTDLLKFGRKIEEAEAARKAFAPPASCSSILEPDLAFVSTERPRENNRERKDRRLRQMQDERVEAAAVVCFNCNQAGHIARGCTAPRTVHCYICGKRDVSTKDCCRAGNERGGPLPAADRSLL